MQRDTFDDLIERARDGNQLAWSILYDRYAPRLRGYAVGRGSQDPDAVVSDVFADVARNVARFDGSEASFRSWIFTIAHHRVIDEHRRNERLAQPDPSPPGNVEAEAIDLLTTEEITGLLRRLSDDQRDVLLLRIVGGLTVTETARVLGKREGAVKAAQRRGLERLRTRSRIFGVTP
jgi:RNA polymerase sigma-70 factor (ECF subfamily)